MTTKKGILKRWYDILRIQIFRIYFLSLMVLFGAFFSVYGYILAIGIFSIIIMHKVLDGDLIDSIFTLKLF